MSKLIEARIAQILSDNLLIITAGAETGVKIGMPFVVLAQGEEVKDPETGKPLGRWELPKGYVRATHVQDRLATCQGFTPGREGDKGGDPTTKVLSAALIAHSMRPETWRGGGAVKLNVNRSEIAGVPKIRPISVGDVVRELPVDIPASEQPKSETPDPPKGDEPSGNAAGEEAPEK